MKPDITRHLDKYLENAEGCELRLEKNNFDKKEIKYLNKRAKEKDISIIWYDSNEED